MKHVMGSNSATKLTNVDDVSVQPNAVDLRLASVRKIRPGVFTITEDEKIHRGSVELTPDENGYFVLTEGRYEVEMQNVISVGEGEAGWVITRSTLNRNGVYLTSGLYDAGYRGPMLAVMHVTTGPMRIKVGTRIGQYLSFAAETLHLYDGSYGFTAEGVARPDEAKLYDRTTIDEVNVQKPTNPLSSKRRPGRPKKNRSEVNG